MCHGRGAVYHLFNHDDTTVLESFQRSRGSDLESGIFGSGIRDFGAS